MPDEKERFNPNIIFERRRFVRIDGTFVLSYRQAGIEDPKSDITQTRNISVGGLLFMTDKLFPLGAILVLKLRLPDREDHIDIKVKVVGSRQIRKNVLYETRAKFVDIKEEDRDAVRKIVGYNLGQQ